MDFTMIGTLHSYVQQKNLKFAANYKQKTGQSLVNSSGNLNLELKAANNKSLVDKMIKAQKGDNSEYTKRRISSIKQKLMNGKKISSEEMGYLKEKDPALYKKAKKAEEARQELKSALRRAKTKEEARKAVTQAMIKASAEATAELAAAKGAAGGGASGAGGGAQGYEASQEIGGPNAEAIQAYVNGDEPSMVRLNEQISAMTTNAETNTADLNEASTLKEINSDIAASNEISAESAVENVAAEANAMINQSDDSADSDATDNFGNADSTQSSKSSSGAAQSDILEKFIMVIRALEDEWATFAKSDEYKELADDMIEEAKIEASGKHKRKKQQKQPVPELDYQALNVIKTYRSSMMFAAKSIAIEDN